MPRAAFPSSSTCRPPATPCRRGTRGCASSCPQRELIADIVETHVRSMLFDGLVMIAGCDKIIPGMIMAAARLDLPTIFLTGGPGAFQIRYSPSMKGSIHHRDYPDLDDMVATATCATCGACELMGTANTFQCLVEALGLTLPGSANVPAFFARKLLFARRTGKRIVKMVEEDLPARGILTMDALENALMVDLAIGGSTNTTLHLPAIAHELGFSLPLSRFNDFNRRIPTLCGVVPNGPHGMQDFYRAGGVQAVMKALGDRLHLDAVNVTGQTLRESLGDARVLDDQVIHGLENPFFAEGGTVVLSGNLAPDGAVIKQSGVDPGQMIFSGPARMFDAEGDCLQAIRERTIREGEVVVIRYEGPRGGPGMPETLAVTLGLSLSGIKNVSLITDGRFSGASSGPCIGHVSPEAFVGGPLAAVRNGDIIDIDIPARKLEIRLAETDIRERLKDWRPPVRNIPPGFMRRYAQTVGSAALGAVLA
ncbi:MAG TPA: dihydroxy-acid dehydratase [Syntrophales bacterium]|nr:dihydroxy-acid dehydratase [Syntrophales bacterium]HOS76914.1 dihydroxy-acid dehydratase [Syntrophales bacterium]